MISETNEAEKTRSGAVINHPFNEYRSETELFGLPLVHVARGIDPKTGFFRVAKGIIAIGDVAVGFVALGGIAVGAIAIGGLGLGLLAIGGLAFGLITFGGLSVGLVFALGGIAFSLMYAIGRLAMAPHIISENMLDEAFLQMLERWLPFITKP